MKKKTNATQKKVSEAKSSFFEQTNKPLARPKKKRQKSLAFFFSVKEREKRRGRYKLAIIGMKEVKSLQILQLIKILWSIL